MTSDEVRRNRALGVAIGKEDETTVQVLLDKGAYPNAVQKCYNNQDNEQLLDLQHPFPEVVLPDHIRVLHHAYYRRNMVLMKILLDAGANILMTTYKDAKNRDRTNIVEQALQRDDREMTDFIAAQARRLMSSDANSFPRSYMDQLEAACRQPREPDHERLHTFVTAGDAAGLMHHVDSASDLEKDKALSYAVHHRKEGMVRLLLQRGAYANSAHLRRIYVYPDMRERDSSGKTGKEDGRRWEEHYSHIDRVIHEAYDNRDFGIIGLLLDSGASLNFWYHPFDGTGRGMATIATRSVVQEDYRMLDLFSKHGWNVNERAPDYPCQTPLFVACEEELGAMMDYLIGLGANSDIQCGGWDNDDKLTCIHTCIENGDRRGVKILMQGGVDMDVCDMTLNNPLVHSIQCYLAHLSRRQIDLEVVAHEDPLDLDDVRDERDEVKRRRGIIKDILIYNWDFSMPDCIELDDYPRDFIPVPRAIDNLVNKYRRMQELAYLKTLVCNTLLCRMHVDFQDAWGRTALHRAVENGQLESVKTLLAMNARDDMTDFWNRTPSEALRRHYFDRRQKYHSPGCNNLEWLQVDQSNFVTKKELSVLREIGRHMLATRTFRKEVVPGLMLKLPGGKEFLVDFSRQLYEFIY